MMDRELTFDDGVLWAAARLVEIYDQPSMAKKILLDSQVDIKGADEADRAFIKKAMEG